MTTATVTLIDKTGSPQANLSDLRWAWFDEDVGALNAPTDQGITETTDGSGVMIVTLSVSALTSGQTGTLMLRSLSSETMVYRVAVD